MLPLWQVRWPQAQLELDFLPRMGVAMLVGQAREARAGLVGKQGGIATVVTQIVTVALLNATMAEPLG